MPDTTLCFVKRQGAAPFADKGDEIERVILPISSDVAIVGSPEKKPRLPLKTINRLLAGYTFGAFVASEQNATFQGLTGRIGKYASIAKTRDFKFSVADLDMYREPT
ncbi:MAG: hypothetical protein AB8C02_12130 [Halioglobus sp.]